MESRIEKLLAPFLEKQKRIEELTNRSFLHPSSKRAYILLYNTKMNYLKGSK
jgi:serine/threonine-protein kinase HipA